MLTLMKIMHEQGELNDAQERFWADRRPEYELYDLENDPHEIANLADNPDYTTVKNDLISKLDAWVKKYDPNSYPEELERVQAQESLMRENHVKRMTARGLDPEIDDEEFLAWWNDRLLQSPPEPH